MEEASLASKWKIAKSPGDWAMPYKKRPPCDSSVANRIISSHLGLPRPKPSASALQARKEAQGEDYPSALFMLYISPFLQLSSPNVNLCPEQLGFGPSSGTSRGNQAASWFVLVQGKDT